MKRLVSFLLLWALCTACSVAVVAESAEISLSFIEQSFEVEGNQIAQLYANFPSLDGMDDRHAMDGVNAAIRDFILRESGFDQACDYAREAYEIDPEAFADYDNMYWVLASGMWALRTETLLSVRYDFTLDAGGPHPWHTIAAQHYDLRTGEPVALEALARDPEGLRARVALEIAQWIETSGFDAFEDADTGGWTLAQGLLTTEGLFVFLNEGEAGPVSAGAVELTVPYERLGDAFTADLQPVPETTTLRELLEQAENMYGGGEFWMGDRLVDWALTMDPNNLEAYLSRAAGYVYEYELGDADRALEALEKAEPLAVGDARPRYDRLMARALHMRAEVRYSEVSDEYGGYTEPGDEGYEVYGELLREIERAIELDPTVAAYHYTYRDIAHNMSLDDEAQLAEVRGAVAEDPENPQCYSDLVYALERMELFEEAAEVYARSLALTDPTGAPRAYQQAEALFASGEHEASLPLYEQAVAEEVYTTLALMHRHEALMGLGRYEEAMSAAREGEELTGDDWLFGCLAAEAYVKLGDVWSARRVLWGITDVKPEYPRALRILASIEKMLPPGAEEAFGAERWDGWEVVATGFYEESPQPYTVVVALRKKEDNVLCVLRRTGKTYTIVLENDKALYPGDRTPVIYYEGHVGEMITIEYEVDLGRSVPGRIGFRFYNDEEDDEERYDFFQAYRETPEPGDDGYEDRYGNFHSTVDIIRYEILNDGGTLTLAQQWGNADEPWNYVGDSLTEIDGDPKLLALSSFDIEVCDALFDAAMAAIPLETTDADEYDGE